jgi:hypothetical protein
MDVRNFQVTNNIITGECKKPDTDAWYLFEAKRIEADWTIEITRGKERVTSQAFIREFTNALTLKFQAMEDRILEGVRLSETIKASTYLSDSREYWQSPVKQFINATVVLDMFLHNMRALNLLERFLMIDILKKNRVKVPDLLNAIQDENSLEYRQTLNTKEFLKQQTIVDYDLNFNQFTKSNNMQVSESPLSPFITGMWLTYDFIMNEMTDKEIQQDVRKIVLSRFKTKIIQDNDRDSNIAGSWIEDLSHFVMRYHLNTDKGYKNNVSYTDVIYGLQSGKECVGFQRSYLSGRCNQTFNETLSTDVYLFESLSRWPNSNIKDCTIYLVSNYISAYTTSNKTPIKMLYKPLKL